MRIVKQALDLPPDPFALARSLANRPGVALFFSERGRIAYLASDPIAVREGLDPEPDLPRTAGLADGYLPRWVGFIPYEACRETELEGTLDPRPEPLVTRPLWLRFSAIARIDQDVVVSGEQPGAVNALCERLVSRASPAWDRVELRSLEPFESGALHRERIRRALTHIGAGDIYQVNLARRLTLSVSGTPWDILQALGTPELPPHACALRFGELGVVAATPELCLLLEPGGEALTSPIKGTRPRSADPARDAELALELNSDPKERAELTMILDVERNDFGRVADPGSVRLVQEPHVVSLPSVHHRQATLSARIGSTVSRTEIFRALLPSGSVTGAPKRRAMQLISELEPHRRGLYTGVLGFIRQDGGVEMSMAIRTLVIKGGIGHYFTGGGIVSDSNPDREVEETRWKAERITALIEASTGRVEKWAD